MNRNHLTQQGVWNLFAITAGIITAPSDNRQKFLEVSLHGLQSNISPYSCYFRALWEFRCATHGFATKARGIWFHRTDGGRLLTECDQVPAVIHCYNWCCKRKETRCLNIFLTTPFPKWTDAVNPASQWEVTIGSFKH